MIDAVANDLDKREGSFVWDTITPAAIELALAYTKLDSVLALGFAQTSSGIYLDYRAGEHGLTRKAATKADGEVTITGTANTVVASGSVFSTAIGTQFATTAAVTLDASGSGTVAVEAVVAGSSGNVPAANITAIPVSIAGVTSVTNSAPTEGGTDTETDADLLTRLLEKVRLPATSGNANHYYLWAREVAGVGDAKVFPIWNGNGTVKVCIIDSNKQPAASDIVTATAAYIEGVRPIGPSVTVESATALQINVTATVALDTNAVLADVQTNFENVLIDYLKSMAFERDYISYAQIGSLLFDTVGVVDYTNLLINSGTANVAVGSTQVAVRGTVVLSV